MVVEDIKRASLDLFIRHGFARTTFGMVAKELNISRPLIYYHFETKTRLAEIVLIEYLALHISNSRATWLNPDLSLAAKFQSALNDSRKKFKLYNPTGKGDRPWSLFARFYLERDVITPSMVATMKRAAREQQAYCVSALEIAKGMKEISSSAPSKALALMIVGMMHQANWLTWATGKFESVETAYTTTLESIQKAHAYV